MFDGCITGKGTYINALGERYDGEFRRGLYHGKGRLITVVGEVLEGEFVDGLLHGYGTYLNSRNDKYEGGKAERGAKRRANNGVSRDETAHARTSVQDVPPL
jgi:hypothetical protein